MNIQTHAPLQRLSLKADHQLVRQFRHFLLGLLFALMAFPISLSAQSTDTVTNNTIIELSKAGIGKAIITSKINTSLCIFDLSTNGLISLKKNGVPDDIVAAMISKGSSAPAPPAQDNTNNASIQNNQPDANSQSGGEMSLRPGVYYFNAQTNDYSEIDEAVTNSKSGGFFEKLGSYETGGLVNSRLKESLSGKEANLKISNAKPLFVIVIDGNGQLGPLIKSPNEIFLVKLKQGRSNRELVVAKSNSISSNVGVDDDVKLQFTYNKVQNGLYELTPNEPIEKGEYGFIYAGQPAADGTGTYKIYDFSINVPASEQSSGRHHHH